MPSFAQNLCYRLAYFYLRQASVFLFTFRHIILLWWGWHAEMVYYSRFFVNLTTSLLMYSSPLMLLSVSSVFPNLFLVIATYFLMRLVVTSVMKFYLKRERTDSETTIAVLHFLFNRNVESFTIASKLLKHLVINYSYKK